MNVYTIFSRDGEDGDVSILDIVASSPEVALEAARKRCAAPQLVGVQVALSDAQLRNLYPTPSWTM